MEDDGTRRIRNILCEEAYEVDDKLESLSGTAEWSLQQARAWRTLAPPCSPCERKSHNGAGLSPGTREGILKGIGARMKEDGDVNAIDSCRS